jgi:flagellar biosynthesis anti-sigma factor FlgM
MNSTDRIPTPSLSRPLLKAADTAETTTRLSDSARWLVTARQTVHNAPDVREAMVAEIKQRIASGTYQVSSRVLARGMLQAAR